MINKLYDMVDDATMQLRLEHHTVFKPNKAFMNSAENCVHIHAIIFFILKLADETQTFHQ